MPKGKFIWRVYKKYVKPLRKPSDAELRKIRHSLCLEDRHPFPRCPGKSTHLVARFEENGDFSHSGNRRKHICEKCRCKHVAGWGTKHYGVGFCYWHDVDNGRQVSKHMAIALQQGYPLNPIKYRSDSEYVEDVRKQAEESHGRLDLAEELVVLRAHLQEIEDVYHKKGDGHLTMKGTHGSQPMTDDVKIDRLTKLVKAISDLSRNAYVITESDYVHADEVKQFLWGIYKMIDDRCKRLITGEIDPNNLLVSMQEGLKDVVLPKTGRRNK